MLPPSAAEALRARVRQRCLSFPGTSERARNSAHSAFLVKDRTFCYFLNDHHGDGVVGVTLKALPGVQGALVDMDPRRFYLPAYMHRHGWVGVRLDVEPLDWDQVDQLLAEAYAASAPKALLRQYQARTVPS